jgi:DNA-binding NarL/FixJ family response regulator
VADADFTEFSQKLDLLIRLVALSLADGKRQSDQILLLSRAGLTPREVADLLDTSANTVSVELSRLRRLGVIKSPGKRR